MTDEQTLLLVLFLFYLAESCFWVRPGTPCLLGLRRGTWQFRSQPHFELGDRGGFVVAGLVPPLGTVIKGNPSKTNIDTRAIRQRSDELESAIRPLEVICNLLFVYVFVFTPGVVLWRGLVASWVPLLIGLTAQMWAVAWFFSAAHRRLYPGPDWIIKTVSILLWPPGAIRAADGIVSAAFSEFAPTAVAYVLCSGHVFRDVARRAYFGAIECGHVEVLLDHTGTRGEVMAPPSAEHHTHRAYCPSCHGQFTRPEGDCPDCPGIGLLPLHT